MATKGVWRKLVAWGWVVVVLVGCTQEGPIGELFTPIPSPNNRVATPTVEGNQANQNVFDDELGNFHSTPPPIPAVTASYYYGGATPLAYSLTPFPDPIYPITTNNVDSLVEFAQFGKGAVQHMRYVDNGESIAIVTTNGIYIHNLDEIDNPPSYYRLQPPLAISANGEVLADENGVLRALEGRVEFSLRPDVFPVALSPNGRYVVIINRKAHESRSTEIRAVDDGSTVSFLPEYFSEFSFSPDGNMLAVDDYFSKIDIYAIPSGEKIKTIDIPKGGSEAPVQAASIDFSPNSKFLAIGFDAAENSLFTAGKIGIFDIASGDQILTIDSIGRNLGSEIEACDEGNAMTHSDHSHKTLDLAYSPDGMLLAALYTSDQLFIYNPNNGSILKVIDDVNAFEFASSNRILLSFTTGEIREVGIFDNEETIGITGYNSQLDSFDISPDGNFLLVNYVNNSKIIDLHDGTITFDAPYGIGKFDQNGNRYAIGYDGGRAEIRSLSDNSILSNFQTQQSEMLDVVFTASGNLVTSAEDCSIMLWSGDTGRFIREFEPYWVEGILVDKTRLNISRIYLSDDGEEIVGLPTRTATTPAWELSTGRITTNMGRLKVEGLGTPNFPIIDNLLIKHDSGRAAGVRTLTFTPLGSKNPIIRYPIHTGYVTFPRISVGFHSIKIHPNLQIIIIASWDGTFRIWGVK